MKSKTYKLLPVVLLLFLGMIANAQRPEMADRLHQKMKAEKIGFITSELDLSESEAISFWPVYNEYEQKKFELKDGIRAIRKDGDDGNPDEKIAQYVTYLEKEFLLEKEYINKFKAVLPSSKVLTLIHLEKKFKEELLKKVRQRMRNKNR